jgi:hypothetical protein
MKPAKIITTKKTLWLWRPGRFLLNGAIYKGTARFGEAKELLLNDSIFPAKIVTVEKTYD